MTDVDKIIALHEKLILKMTTRFYDVPKEDLYQAGVIGVIKAYKNYQNDGKTKFTTYAFKYIYGEMYETANNYRAIKLNKDILKLYKKIEQAKALLTARNNRVPSFSELASYLDIQESVIAQIYNCTGNIMSLDNEEQRPVYEAIPDKQNRIPSSYILDIKDSLETLTPEEKEIIKCRYFKDFTQTETAKMLGISQVKVSRYEKKGLNKMYNYLVN